MNILFVCSGNTCRSPMAEGYLSSKKIDGITATSRGFFSSGECVSKNSADVMKEIGIDISYHRSKVIDIKDLENCDRIICMDRSHFLALENSGVQKEKMHILGGGIPDPYGCDINAYRSCRNTIIKEIDLLIKNGFFDEIKIVKAEEYMADDIFEIEKSVFSQPWSLNSIKESFSAKTHFFVAFCGEKAVGYVGISAIAGEGYITNIGVIPQFRKKGVASRLLENLIKFASEIHLEFISLEVRTSNSAAISLYSKMGFENAGIRKGFYTNPKEDAIIMTRRFLLDENIGD